MRNRNFDRPMLKLPFRSTEDVKADLRAEADEALQAAKRQPEPPKDQAASQPTESRPWI